MGTRSVASAAPQGSGSSRPARITGGTADLHPLRVDAAEWRRHRRARLAAAAAAPFLALFAPGRYRPLVLAAVLLLYLPVAVAMTWLKTPPRQLDPAWWAGLLADCLVLGLALALVPEVEPVAFLGFLLVVVVNSAAFGVQAGIVAGGLATASVLGALAAGIHKGEVAVDVLGFLAAVGLVASLVGRQAEDLRRHQVRLEDALADLRRVDELRSGLVSTLAHDVRGPLGAIRGALRTLMHRRDELDPDIQMELLQRADRQTERLLRLAGGLLDLARL